MNTVALNETDEVIYDFAAIVAENIRARAARKGLKQTDIARELGITYSAINARWHGRRQWQLEDIARVANVLDTTPWALTQPEYENSRRFKPANLYELPQLDSNQQPFD
ncbi:helix-turn-helix domain-containing protein [Arcanobacterium haemolyticum]